MTHRSIDPTQRTLRINLARETYRQSSSVGVDGIINKSRQLVRVQRSGPDTILTFFDHHSLKYIIKTVRNEDPETGDPKSAFIGPVTWNAEKVRKWRDEPNFLRTIEKEKERLTVEDVPATDMDWKSDVRFFGIRDALLGEVSYRTRER